MILKERTETPVEYSIDALSEEVKGKIDRLIEHRKDSWSIDRHL